MAEDMVNRPRHYNQHPSGVEAIELCEQLSFNVGNAVKYLFRRGHKEGAAPGEDVQKALFYLRAEVRRIDRMADAIGSLIDEHARYVSSAPLADRIKMSYAEKGIAHD